MSFKINQHKTKNTAIFNIKHVEEKINITIKLEESQKNYFWKRNKSYCDRIKNILPWRTRSNKNIDKFYFVTLVWNMSTK